jgi:hypothetical protein
MALMQLITPLIYITIVTVGLFQPLGGTELCLQVLGDCPRLISKQKDRQ